MHDEIRKHYDALVDEQDDPVLDPPKLRAYMDLWDGETFLSALRLDTTKSVLEIGVGTGRLATRVVENCGSFTGIDLSKKAIARANQHLAGKNVRLYRGDFLTFPFPDRFDIAYSSLTFFHIENKRAAIEKAYALLRSGGRFVLSIEKAQRDTLVCGARTLRLYPDDPKTTHALLTAIGFQIERIETEFAYIFIADK